MRKSMSILAQELANVAGQAKAPVLAEATQASGQGALTPVQAPGELVPVRPGHLAVEDIKALENEAQSFALSVMNERFRARTDALMSRRQEN